MTYLRFRSKIWRGMLAIALLLWGWHYVYHNKALSFSVARITSDFSCHPQWDTGPLTPDERQNLDQILSQPFHYLGAGSQSYAFVSEDGKTVIKFFRMKHQIFHLKDLWTHDRSEERRKNLLSIYDSHMLAYRKMKEDAGLIYLHLNKTDHLHKKIKLIDRLHRTHKVDLDQVEFVLQERAELIFSRLKKFLEQNDREGLNTALTNIMHLIQRRIDKGIADHDKAVTHNFGFVGDRAIQIDIGRIYEESERAKDYTHIQERIDRWLDKQR